jgi:hypothetical protein
MIFVIQFDQKEGRLKRLDTFTDADREKANRQRVEVEIELLKQNVFHEVVVLEAKSVEALKKTHRRYFDSIAQWSEDFRDSLGSIE